MKTKKKYVWFWYSAGHLQRVEFIRWCKTKMSTGREDNNKIGIGAVVKSDWLFKVHGGTRQQAILTPYTELYRTHSSGMNHRNAIKRPSL